MLLFGSEADFRGSLKRVSPPIWSPMEYRVHLVSVPSLKSRFECPVPRRRDGLGVPWGSRHYCALPKCHGRPSLPHDPGHILLRSHRRLLSVSLLECREHTHDFSGSLQGSEALPTSLSVIESGT